MKDIIELFEKAILYWDKKRGIIFINIIIIFTYYEWGVPLFTKMFPFYINWVYGTIALPVSIVTFFWLFNTNRLYFSNKKFTVGLIIRVDCRNTEAHLKKIVKSCVEDIKKDFPDIKVVLYPINYKKNEKEIERHIKLRILPIDGFVVATAESGNITVNGQSTNKIELSKFYFAGNFDINTDLALFRSTLSINKDLSLRFMYKNWSYVENNSFDDKKKIKHNLKDTLLHFSGIYLIYKQELEIALNILKDLYKPNPDNLKIVNGSIVLTKEQYANLRLNHILLNLYFQTAISDYYQSKSATKAYSLLLECNRIFPDHPERYSHLIPLANFAYQCGDIESAILFTKQAKDLRGETIDVLLNNGFFALLDFDVNKLKSNYSKISRTKIPHNYNITEVISFFEEQRSIIKDKLKLIDFAEAILTKLYLDIDYGNALIDEFIGQNNGNDLLLPLINLCEDVRRNVILNIYILSNRKNNRNKRKKLKRKRK